MMVYRLAKAEFINDLSGKGAELSGGRWNRKGTPMLYTSSSRALCTAEIAVHTPLGILPKDYTLACLEFPSTLKILELKIDELPSNWNSISPIAGTQQAGDIFIQENLYMVMKVPSVVVQGDYNYIFNPRHKDFEKLKIKSIEAFHFDARLFNKK